MIISGLIKNRKTRFKIRKLFFILTDCFNSYTYTMEKPEGQEILIQIPHYYDKPL